MNFKVWEAWLVRWSSSLDLELAARIQILDEAFYISLLSNVPEKKANSSLPPSAIGKIYVLWPF